MAKPSEADSRQARGEPFAAGTEACSHFQARCELPLLVALVVLAAAVRAWSWRQTAAMFNDGPVFLGLARAIGEGDWATALSHPFHPLYPAVVAAAAPLAPDLETAAVSVSIVFGSLTVAALYALVRAAFDREHALVAAAALAVHPMHIEYTGDIQSEGVYLACFVAAGAALFVSLRNGRSSWAAGGGAFAGLAYLARPEGLGIAIVAAVLGLGMAVTGRWSARRARRWLAALTLGLLALALPYLLLLRVETGAWSATQKKSVAVMVGLAEAPRDGPSLDGAGAPPRAGEEPPEGPAPTPTEALDDVWRSHIRAFRYEPLLLLLLGFAIPAGRRLGLRELFVAGVILAYAGLLSALALNFGYVSARHALPPLTLAFGHVAAGLLLVAGALAPRLSRRRPAPAGWVAALLLAAVAVAGLSRALKPARVESAVLRRAAEWVRRELPEAEAVAARKRRTAYYAGARFVAIEGPTDSVLSLSRAGASLLILRDDELDHYPALRDGLAIGQARRLHRAEALGFEASVYQLSPSPGRAP